MDGQLNAKIADLELGVVRDKSCEQTSSGGQRVEDLLPNWLAPEVLAGAAYTQASDVYAFALVLWELRSKKVPFSDVKEPEEIRRKVCRLKR